MGDRMGDLGPAGAEDMTVLFFYVVSLCYASFSHMRVGDIGPWMSCRSLKTIPSSGPTTYLPGPSCTQSCPGSMSRSKPPKSASRYLWTSDSEQRHEIATRAAMSPPPPPCPRPCAPLSNRSLPSCHYVATGCV